MSWQDSVERANAIFAKTWPMAAQFYPQTGDGPIDITGVIDKPAMLEDALPGSSIGVNVLRLWVDFAKIQPAPQKGDKLAVNGANYDLFEIDVDPDGGGALLKLRRNA